MSEILFASPGQTIDAAMLASGGDDLTLDERIAAIERLNPSLNGKTVTLGQFTPFFIPGPNETDNQMCDADFGVIRAEYTALPLDAKKSIDDLGAEEAFTLLQAIDQFKVDHLPQYGLGAATADTNTFAGGIIGAQLARSAGLVSHMRYIEGLLKEYQLAKGAQRVGLKVSINSAYKALNSEFGTVLNKYVARAETGKLGSVLSRRQGMKAALKGRTRITNSAQVRPLLSSAKGFNYISKGLLAMDIGFRVNNVVHSNTRGRTFTSELMGFGGAFFASFYGGTIAATLALGPLGWIVAIFVIGVVAVGTDAIGKKLGNSIYDLGGSLYNNSDRILSY